MPQRVVLIRGRNFVGNWPFCKTESMDQTICGQRGQRVGADYELLEPIAVGPQDTVWEAKHDNLRQRVSVKLIRTSGDDASLVADKIIRQVRQLCNRLKHPSIAEFFDAGEWEKSGVYLVSSLELGSSLRDRLDGYAVFTQDQQRSIMSQVVAALSAAHELGVVHGSLSPSKIILRNDLGRDALRVRVLGFGLPKSNSDSTRDSMAERPSWAYWAPELATDLEASRASDVYSLSVVFFELLTGRLPPSLVLGERSAFDVLLESKHLLATACPDLEESFIEALIGCLHADPKRRFLYWPDLCHALSKANDSPPKPTSQSNSVLLYPRISEFDGAVSGAEKWLALSVSPGKRLSKGQELLGLMDKSPLIWTGRSAELTKVAISIESAEPRPIFTETLRFVRAAGSHGSLLPEDLVRPRIPKPPRMPEMEAVAKKIKIIHFSEAKTASPALATRPPSRAVLALKASPRFDWRWLPLGLLVIAALWLCAKLLF